MTEADAKEFVDKAGGVTLGGLALADMYFAKYCNDSGNDMMTVSRMADDVRHWIVCAGYNEQGEFNIETSPYKLNC